MTKTKMPRVLPVVVTALAGLFLIEFMASPLLMGYYYGQDFDTEAELLTPIARYNQNTTNPPTGAARIRGRDIMLGDGDPTPSMTAELLIGPATQEDFTQWTLAIPYEVFVEFQTQENYSATFPADLEPGLYSFLYRFNLDETNGGDEPGDFLYADLDGSGNGIAIEQYGRLIVEAPLLTPTMTTPPPTITQEPTPTMTDTPTPTPTASPTPMVTTTATVTATPNLIPPYEIARLFLMSTNVDLERFDINGDGVLDVADVLGYLLQFPSLEDLGFDITVPTSEETEE